MYSEAGIHHDVGVTTGAVAATPVDSTPVHIDVHGDQFELDPLWLLATSTEDFDLDPSSRQRVYDPLDVHGDLRVVGHRTLDGILHVDFSDGRTRRFVVDELRRRVALEDREAPPAAVAWATLDDVPWVDWADIEVGDGRELHRVIGDLFRFGCCTVRGAPTEPGALHRIAACFGRVSATNFGALFDVESVAQPIDLAYSAVGLAAHTDQPYRRPTPGLQFLHTICNDAPGGESTIADGLAGTDALRVADPDGFSALCELDVEFRYDIGTDVVADRAPVIELGRSGLLRQLRFSPRLDTPPLATPEVLTAWFRARRWLAAWFEDPAHRVEFKMVAGDVMVVDNHRVLHGRRPFDPGGGKRHLQGCYIDHDGPATMWRLLSRRLTENGTTT